MGFRELKAFNKALLAKQLWRICSRPESFVAKVFRVKYCRDGDFLRATARAGCSFVWRSIIGSKEVVSKGACWRIGDGSKVRVFLDRWVEKGINGLVCGKEEKVVSGLKVMHLWKETGGWDEELLEDMFLPNEIDAIRKVQVGRHGNEDTIRWEHEPGGNFSVKTAYLQEIGFFDPCEGTSDENKKFWHDHIWSNSVPPKTKIMLWKACNNFLPTAGNLRLHHVPVDGVCKLCFDRWDSTEHALLFCPKVKKGWKNSRYWRLMKRAKMLDFLSIVAMIRNEYNLEEFEVWCIMVWLTWMYVCRVVHDENGAVDEVTEAGSWTLWEGYQNAQVTRGRADHLGVPLGGKRWVKPRQGVFRVDVDAAFNPAINAFGFGVIIRDADGRVVVAAARKSSPSSNVMLAEVMAIVRGIVTCVEREIYPVEIYTDSILATRLMAKRGGRERALT